MDAAEKHLQLRHGEMRANLLDREHLVSARLDPLALGLSFTLEAELLARRRGRATVDAKAPSRVRASGPSTPVSRRQVCSP